MDKGVVMKLKRSNDRKVANLVTKNGKQAAMANTFGLPAGKEFSCPGATSICESVCYAGKLEKLFKECVKKNAPMLFRIHWDGDFFSEDYTRAWKLVIEEQPDIKFWVYTRVRSAALILKDIPNLSLYYSTDDENLPIATELKQVNGVRLAYLGKTFALTETKMKEITGKVGAKCPENNKSIPLISNAGSACVSCGLCVYGKADIRFSATKK